MATYIVKKGDCLWSIASRYLGSGTRWTQLADLNGIPRNNPIIYVGQKINLDAGSVSAPKPSAPKPVVQSRATVEFFGLQAGTDNTMFATWKWDRANTEKYQVWWEYDTGNGIWFVGSNTTVEHNIKQSTYSAPSNAVGVQFWIKPISQTRTVNNSEVSYWTAEWSTAKQYYFSQNPPTVPTNLSVEIKDYKLTAEAQYANDITAASGIEFQVVKNNSTVFKTGKAGIKTTIATYSCTVDAGAEYKVRCRAYRGNLYGDWSEYSSNVKTEPAAPSGITQLRATSESSVYIEWSTSLSAESYDIEYTTKKEYFDGSDKTTTISNVEFNHYEKTGLESGEQYFFRVRAVNNKGHSAWTGIKSVIIGKKPSAPTTWSSTTTAVVGEPLNLYWVHNSEDGSSETYAEVELYVDGLKETHTVENTNSEDEKDKTKVFPIDTSKYKEGVKIQWRVRTAGITKQYGDWSIQRVIDIYAPPTLEFSITDVDGNIVDTLTSFPFYAKGFAGPNTQKPIGYYLNVIANEMYEAIDNTGIKRTIRKGDQVYSKYFDTTDPLLVELSAGNIDLENNISYTITCIVSMNSGLTTEESHTFTVAWTDDKFEPNAEIGLDKDTLVTYIRPYCDYYPYVYYKVINNDGFYTVTDEVIEAIDGSSVDGVFTDTNEIIYSGTTLAGEAIYFVVRDSEVGVPVKDVLLSVYRREFDGGLTELATGIENNRSIYITDPHPALDFARYRIVAITKSTGAVSFYDVPGYPIEEKAVIIQWDEEWSQFETSSEDELKEPPWSGSLLKLPYNIDVSDNHSSDVSLVNYIGRKRPVSYYGTHLGETSNWKVEIDKEDTETLYALRRLAIWMGDVYVREPSGSGYWASISVSFSQTHCEVTIPVTLDITRVEGGI